MAGPLASVLLHEALTKQQEDELEVWLRSNTDLLEKGKADYDFRLNEDIFPGTVSRCLFNLSVGDAQEQEDWEQDEIRQIKESLGYLPRQSIGVWSGCNQPEDHSTLAQLVLHLALVCNGLIDMRGAITPPHHKGIGEELSPKALEEIRTYVRAMPGKMYEIEYTTVSGYRWIYHLVDVAFFRAWIEHPHFHMIK